MKIKSIRAGVHRLSVTVPLLKAPIVRNAVICEIETDDGYAGSGLTGGAYLPFAIVTARSATEPDSAAPPSSSTGPSSVETKA